MYEPSSTYVYDLTLGIMIWIAFFIMALNIVYFVGIWKVWRRYHEIVQKIV